MRKYIYIIISLVLFIGISWFSSRPAEISSSQSDTVIVKLNIMTEEELIKDHVQANKVRHSVRKAAHFSIYGILGVFVCLSVSSFIETKIIAYLTALSITIILAILDEFHQSFVPGRSMEFTDVMIDGLGAAIFSLVIMLGVHIFNEKKKKSEIYYYRNKNAVGIKNL